MLTLRKFRRAGVAVALLLLGLAVLAAGDRSPAAETGRLVAVLDIKGPIGPATSDFFGRSLDKAASDGAHAVVLRIDTPGGLSTAMRDIIRDIISSPVPVVGFVAPGGARAASAGTYILYATHIAAMAPGTNLGAATPVPLSSPIPGIGGGDDKDKGKDKESKGAKPPKEAMSEKAINDARAYIRSLAQMRGRNVEWAEQAVTEAASLSSADALRLGVIDLVAADLPDLLAKIDGRKVKLARGEVRLETKNASVKVIVPDWRAEFLAVITNPNVAYILLLIGIYGLIFEFYNPGTFVPGVMGAISLLLALYALHVLPVNYAGLGLILLGVAFMAAEAFVPAFGALGLGGIAALVIGSVILIDTEAPGFGLSWVVIGSVAAVSAVLSFTVMAMAARAWRRPVVSGREAMVGMAGRVIEWRGREGRVRTHGELWKARAEAELAPGETIRITAVEGLTLVVAPAETTKGDEHGHSA